MSDYLTPTAEIPELTDAQRRAIAEAVKAEDDAQAKEDRFTRIALRQKLMASLTKRLKRKSARCYLCSHALRYVRVTDHGYDDSWGDYESIEVFHLECDGCGRSYYIRTDGDGPKGEHMPLSWELAEGSES